MTTIRYRNAAGELIVARRIGDALVEITVYDARVETKPGARITQTSQMFAFDHETLAGKLLSRVADAMAGDRTPAVRDTMTGTYRAMTIDDAVRWICPASTRVVRELEEYHLVAGDERATARATMAGMPRKTPLMRELECGIPW